MMYIKGGWWAVIWCTFRKGGWDTKWPTCREGEWAKTWRDILFHPPPHCYSNGFQVGAPEFFHFCRVCFLTYILASYYNLTFNGCFPTFTLYPFSKMVASISHQLFCHFLNLSFGFVILTPLKSFVFLQNLCGSNLFSLINFLCGTLQN